ncbi:hypothetical protein [Serratia ureilytica]|uniref:hypothetical protein n=1 Tax=Serratia ureilytica TaxID=300181 RepID=UPI0018D77939|nr:hypothetical protein [Serratia ureilytica]MBH3177350.1 hypothetical protein [Serratia ureilytica]
MAASLLELVIPASVSVVVACGTVIATNAYNKRSERKRIITEKKDFLFSLHMELLSHIDNLKDRTLKGSADTTNYAVENLNTKNNLTLKIKMLTRLYFSSLDENYIEVFSRIDHIFLLEINGISARLDDYMLASSHMDEISNIILEI